MGRTGLPRAYKELIGMIDLIKNAGVNWTVVRFTATQVDDDTYINRARDQQLTHPVGSRGS